MATINVWEGSAEQSSKWRAEALLLRQQLYNKAKEAEGRYYLIRPYLGADAPKTLKEFLQKAIDEGQDEPGNLSPFLQTIRHHNENFARKLEEEQKENWKLRAGGIHQENEIVSKIANYLMDIVPEAITADRINIDFEGTGKDRKLNVRLDEKQIVGEVTDKAKTGLIRFVQESADKISGTGRMKSLKTLSKITPNIGIVHSASGEKIDSNKSGYTNQDFAIELGMTFHYGSDSNYGYESKFIVQNKAAASYKEENKYKAVMQRKNVSGHADIVKMFNSSFKHRYGSGGSDEDVVGFFCIGGKVMYSYEILQLIYKDLVGFEQRKDWKGLQNYLTY